jgi:hypothetical protein
MEIGTFVSFASKFHFSVKQNGSDCHKRKKKNNKIKKLKKKNK